MKIREEKDMKNALLRKGLVVGIIILFIGTSSSISAVNTRNELANVIDYIKNHSSNIEIFYPTDDALIRENDPDKPQGHNIHVNVRNHGGGDWTYQGLIKFDLSSIPSGTNIISASLNCYYNKYWDNNPSGNIFNLYRITSDWEEGNVTWNTQPSCISQPSCFVIMPSSPGVWLEWNVTSDVKDFISGIEDNFGWKISDDTYWPGVNIPLTRLCSKEYEDNIPYLEVEIEEDNGLKTTFVFGSFKDINTEGNTMIIDALNIRCIQTSPFAFVPYTSGEKLIISKDGYVGLLIYLPTTKFIVAKCLMEPL